MPPGSDPMNVSTEIYVCHANVIRYFTLRALQLNPAGWLRLTLPHAGIVWLTVDYSFRLHHRNAYHTVFDLVRKSRLLPLKML